MLFLISESGSYIQLFKTTTRSGYKARMFTDYYSTTGLCIGFACSFLSMGETKLRVLAIREDKSEVIIGTVENNDYGLGAWVYFWENLPNGFNMIMIEGQRGQGGSSGIAVDDIEVKKCPLFRGKLLQ